MQALLWGAMQPSRKKRSAEVGGPPWGLLLLLRPAALLGKNTSQWPVFFQKRAAFPPLRVGGFPDLREPLLRGAAPPPFRLPRRSNAPCRSPGADSPHFREQLRRATPRSSRPRNGRSSAPVCHPARTFYLLRASGHCAPPLSRKGGGGFEMMPCIFAATPSRRQP